uniref:hypothetical protein n=1 Tax=uncultured Hydrogenophaga sp. TaxID=199683 RepID=UPI002590D6A2
NGHHIKMNSDGGASPWDHSFERVFDKADRSFPALIRGLENLERKPVRGAEKMEQRFVPQACTDDMLATMSECATSLAVRGPMNREACVSLAEQIRGPIPASERNALMGMNMKNSQRVVADGIGANGKFVVIYSLAREFIFGDGFFHNVRNVHMMPMFPKMFVPLTPQISLLVCRPSRYTVEPKLTTLVLEDHEVALCNLTVQIYSKNAIYYRSEQPGLDEAFRSAEHLCYADEDNPVDSLIRSIPGVHVRTRRGLLLDQPVVREFRR